MNLTPGARLGSYEITAKLGEGGMGEVWRARDSQLGREVALKVLPESFSADPERTARFEREAKLLASLNHPNIAQIYGLETSEDTRALIMELVEGPTLADRLESGSLPLNETLSIARQIAAALEEAHEKGIIHRDLKPQNIKAAVDGQVKVLDFGLAKALDPVSASGMPAPDFVHSPTVTFGTTREGVILGTAAYMAPEQARGLPVDHRADVWAFGVVLHEMLTGSTLFAAPTLTDTLAAVLSRDVDWDALPPATPPAMRRLLRRCLERNPKNRLHSIADARIVIDEVLAAPHGGPDPRATAATSVPRIGSLGLGLIALVAALGATGIWWASRQEAPASPPIVATLLPPEGTSYYLQSIGPGPATLSPDGSKLAFAAIDGDSVVRLWVRELATGDQHSLSGTEWAQYPFWSPDGRWIGFFSQTETSLRKIQATGGAPITVTAASNGKGGTWNEDGVILFSPGPGASIHRVSEDGGESTPVTTLDEGRFNSHRHPRFLPDGRHFLYLGRTPDPERNAVLVSSLEGTSAKEILASATQAEYAAGYLLFAREGSLLAQPFDPETLELGGSPIPVATGVASITGSALALFSTSKSGPLVFLRGSLQQPVQLELRGRDGSLLERLATPSNGFRDLEFSPDGQRAVFARMSPQTDLYILDLERRAETRFTVGSGEEIWPVWTPDGETVLYASNPSGPHDIYRKTVAGLAREELVLDLPDSGDPLAVSPDSRFLLYQRNLETGRELWRLNLESGETARVLEQKIYLSRAAFSPNGRWILFVATEEGRRQVFATPHPGPGRTLQVSIDGGEVPHWRRDGKEILFLDADGFVISMPVADFSDSLELGHPETLFRAIPPSSGFKNFAASPDGQRFLVAPDGALGADNELVLVAGWTKQLEAR